MDNEAKACLDEVALELRKQPGAKAVVVGNSDAKEKAKTAKDYLVPSGASFAADVTGTTPVDETAVKAQPRKPLAVKAHKKAAAKPAVK